MKKLRYSTLSTGPGLKARLSASKSFYCITLSCIRNTIITISLVTDGGEMNNYILYISIYRFEIEKGSFIPKYEVKFDM